MPGTRIAKHTGSIHIACHKSVPTPLFNLNIQHLIVWIVNVKEFQKFTTFTNSLLNRSSKLSELISQLEIELGDKGEESIEGKRVAKPLSNKTI